MTLAIFDLDNTLIAGDSDHLWGEFLCRQGIVDAQQFGARNEQFYADYCAGKLDIEAYIEFALAPLAGRSRQSLAGWQAAFMQEYIRPIMLPAAQALLDSHRQQGHRLLIITATNEFVTAPIAEALRVDTLLGCAVEEVDGLLTGRAQGTLSYREGKVTRFQEWLAAEHEDPAGAWFYSDSHNDLPLLRAVDNPVAVDPDRNLAATARACQWPIISLRA